MSDDGGNIKDRREADLDESFVGYAEWDASSAKADSCNSSVKGSARHMLSNREHMQKLAGERGFFYPVTESIGTIKFVPSRGLAASATVEVTYREKEWIDNLLWEVADGQEVSFDAVQTEGNTWITALVWIGQRPAKPLVGNSEAVNRLTRKPLTNAGPGSCRDFG
ncbi:hypothetical protein HPB48_005926 [Haemaphysalis longicornis]|uniref:Uncharacterized protein n=1 Tax=Haemaphysalis longicornis TaxID=44386 RepID=A0A9J6FKG9_HAELO|nr:hypothetical protein HPB48_005926 [Haemaphysalis longicornis]